MISAVRGAEIWRLVVEEDGVGGAEGYVEVLKYADMVEICRQTEGWSSFGRKDGKMEVK
jgi:hypothetical protein